MAETLNIVTRQQGPAPQFYTRMHASGRMQAMVSSRQPLSAMTGTLATGAAVGSAFVSAMAPYSAAISGATAMAQVTREMALMRAASKVEGPAAGLIGSASRVAEAGIDALGSALRPILRLLEPIVDVLSRLAEFALSAIGSLFDFLNDLLRPVFRWLDEMREDLTVVIKRLAIQLGLPRKTQQANMDAWFRNQMRNAAGLAAIDGGIATEGAVAPDRVTFEQWQGLGVGLGDIIGEFIFGGEGKGK